MTEAMDEIEQGYAVQGGPVIEDNVVPIPKPSENTPAVDAAMSAPIEADKKSCCQTCMRFEGRKIVQGFNILGIGRGPLLMSNVFLVTALTYLANEEAGCVQEVESGHMEVIDNCNARAFGIIRPTSLMTNVALIAGLLSALLMPLLGAIIDYTPYRWQVGVFCAIALIAIQAVQIGTNSYTWLAMAVLQAFAWFLFNVEIITTYAYLPAIAGLVSEQTMNQYTSVFYSNLFSSQIAFMVLVVASSMALDLQDVETARISQGINTVILIPTFYFGWRLMPKVSARHKLPINPRTGKSRSLWTCGSVVAVVFLTEEMGLSSTEIGVFFVVGMLATPFGTGLNYLVSNKTNPKISYMLVMVYSQASAIIGALTLTKENVKPGGYIWAIFVGLGTGWYNPAQILFFSMVTPRNGHETELAGLFSYCLVILLWLPHLIFSSLVEVGVPVQYGVIAISGFFTVSFLLLCMAAPWTDILEETEQASTDAINEAESAEQNTTPEITEHEKENSNSGRW
ncbi:expressed unknown protein [Seminavis robusta]|uniref:Uncharacterized protein n=1 Tax=Seminavis robusta TaxID=568900 RepID=A0A9N8HIX1_9STRA|nr:expressed unknown protein [Seminavis robusta]|eukprot:Sro622_g176890.1 n/a (511) ;mRNA; r:8570-10457